MYNYQNTRKHNESYQRKASGPNADQAKLAMQPGAYRMPGANKVPDWVTAAMANPSAVKPANTGIQRLPYLTPPPGTPKAKPALMPLVRSDQAGSEDWKQLLGGRPPMPMSGGVPRSQYDAGLPAKTTPAEGIANRGVPRGYARRGADAYRGGDEIAEMADQGASQRDRVEDIMEATRPVAKPPTLGMDQDRIGDLNRMYGAPYGPMFTEPEPALPKVSPEDYYGSLESEAARQASERAMRAGEMADTTTQVAPQLEEIRPRSTAVDQDAALEAEQGYPGLGAHRRYSGALTPQQQREANARADRAIGNAEAIMLDSQNTRDGYAARTESLRKEADNVARRTDRAESALRGELGPRAPQADISGPYYRDEQTGLPKNNRVTSNYSISEAQKAREDKLREEMQRDGDAYRARLAEQDAATARELGLQARDKDGVFIKDEDGNPMPDVTAVQQMHRDAADFSAARAIYKRGGGTLPIRDYIKQAAKQGKLSPALTKQLEVNYGLDLSPGKLEALSKEDIDAPRDTAIANRAAEREAAAEARRPIAEEAREINAQVAADRAAGYYNTRPFRVQERNKREAQRELLDNEGLKQDRQEALRAADRAYEDAKADRAMAQQRADAFNNAYAEGLASGAFKTKAEKDQFRRDLYEQYYGNPARAADPAQAGQPQAGEPVSTAPGGTPPSEETGAPNPNSGRTIAPEVKQKLTDIGTIPEGMPGAVQFADAIQGSSPEQIKQAAEYAGFDVSPENVKRLHKQLMDEADAFAREQYKAEGKSGVFGNTGPQERYLKHRGQFMRDKGALVELLMTLDPSLENPHFYVPYTYRNSESENAIRGTVEGQDNQLNFDTIRRNAVEWMGW